MTLIQNNSFLIYWKEFLLIFILSFLLLYLQFYSYKYISLTYYIKQVYSSLSSSSSSLTSLTSSSGTIIITKNENNNINNNEKDEESNVSYSTIKKNNLSNDLKNSDNNTTNNNNNNNNEKNESNNFNTINLPVKTGPIFPLRCYPLEGPSPRTGGGMCLDDESGILAICGGMNENKFCHDLHLYVTAIDKWIVVSNDTSEGCLYSNIISFDGRVCSYGGFKAKSQLCSEVRGFDFEINKWEILPCKTNKPPARFNSTLTSIGDNYFVLFGGRDENGLLLDDMWFLEITEESEVTWEKIVVNKDISTNITSTSNSNYNNNTNMNNKTENTTHTVGKTTAYHRKKENPIKRKQQQQQQQQQQNYISPVPREAHSMVCIDEILVLLGGHNDSNGDSQINDGCVEIFNLITNQWSQIPTNGQGPDVASMIGGSAHRIGETMQILVIGGSPGGNIPGIPASELLCSDIFCPIYILDISSIPYQWKPVNIDWKGPDLTMPPESRCFFSSCYDSKSMYLYLHGGVDLHGVQQAGLCVLDCSSLSINPNNSNSKENINKNNRNQNENENENYENNKNNNNNNNNNETNSINNDYSDEDYEEYCNEPVQEYVDSHFYKEFLELIKPDKNTNSSSKKEISSIAPLPI